LNQLKFLVISKIFENRNLRNLTQLKK